MDSPVAMSASATASRAEALHAQVLAALRAGRAATWRLAEAFYEFHQEQGWLELGYGSLTAYLEAPDVAYRRTAFYHLVDLWRGLHVEGGLDHDRLVRVEWTKMVPIRRALAAGDVTLERALKDAEQLSQDELQAKYAQPKPSNGRAPVPVMRTTSVAPASREDAIGEWASSSETQCPPGVHLCADGGWWWLDEDGNACDHRAGDVTIWLAGALVEPDGKP